jgi:hypothetical protein
VREMEKKHERKGEELKGKVEIKEEKRGRGVKIRKK